jgi:hypothetical protein
VSVCALLTVEGWERRTLSAEELARDVEGFASHNDNLLAVEQLLSDSAGEATKQVTLAVNDHDWLEGRHLAQVSQSVTGK